MADERNRVVVDPGYASDIGLATYCFALCEWNAVWCSEKLKPGYIGTIEPKKKTAGKIASDLKKLAQTIADTQLRDKLKVAADEFAAVVDERNALLHAKPGTANAGTQRLFRHGSEWSPEAVQRFADRVTRCSMELNEILHKRLK